MRRPSKLLSGTVWSTVSSISTSVVHLLRLAILARLLTKADFGLVAMLTFVLGLTQTLSDLGFSSAIMHKRELSNQAFSSLYWIQFIIFICFYFLVFLFRFPIAHYYREPLLVTLLPVALLDLIFQGIGKLYDVLAQKCFQFKLLAIRNIVSSIFSLLLAVVLAYSGFGVYSLLLSSLAQTFILQTWNFIVGQRFIKLRFFISFHEVVPLVRIGAYQMGTQILDYLSSKIDVLVLGRVLGAEILGVYNLAKELVLKIVAVVNSIANRVALPYFSSVQDDNATVRNNYCKMLSLLSYINFPICLIIGALSFSIVPLLYGPEYPELAPIVSILSVWGMVVCICNPVGSIVTAKGRTDLAFYYTIIRLLIYLPVTVFVARWGIIWLSTSQVLLSILLMFLAWYLELFKTIRLPFLKYLRSFSVNWFIAVIGVAFFFYLLRGNRIGIGPLILDILIVILYYLSFCYLFDRKNVISIIHSVKQVI